MSNQAEVLAVLKESNGEDVTSDYIEMQTGLKKSQVQNVIFALKRKIETGQISGQIVDVIKGNVWRYELPRSTNGRLFEELATTKAGTILVQDEDGTVYKLQEIE